MNGTEIKGAEIYSDFIQRALCGINKALSQNNGSVLIVSHGGVFWAVSSLQN